MLLLAPALVIRADRLDVPARPRANQLVAPSRWDHQPADALEHGRVDDSFAVLQVAHKSASPARVPQSTSAPRQIAGALVSTPYGNGQVSATVVPHQLTDVPPLQLTDAG